MESVYSPTHPFSSSLPQQLIVPVNTDSWQGQALVSTGFSYRLLNEKLWLTMGYPLNTSYPGLRVPFIWLIEEPINHFPPWTWTVDIDRFEWKRTVKIKPPSYAVRGYSISRSWLLASKMHGESPRRATGKELFCLFGRYNYPLSINGTALPGNPGCFG